MTFPRQARELETARLRLRPWRVSDAPINRELWTERDPRSVNVIDADGRPTVDDLRARIEIQLAESERLGIELLAIEVKDAPGFIGYCGLIVGQATLEEPELAYEFLRRVQGNGYATEAAAAILEAARAAGRTRLWATVREWNTASFQVLEKIGFTESGRRDVDPVRGDSVWMTWAE